MKISKALCTLVLVSSTLQAEPVKWQMAPPTDPLVVAHNMVLAWNALDAEAIGGLFAEDGTYQSMMKEPIAGRSTIQAHFAGVLEGATYLQLRLRNVAVNGNVVFLERLDVFTVNGKEGATPVVAVLEIADGKVKAWREYYDRADLLREMGVTAP